MDAAATEQIKNARKGALYVWHSDVLAEPLNVCRHLHRHDLQIVPFSWTIGMGARPRTNVDVIFHPLASRQIAYKGCREWSFEEGISENETRLRVAISAAYLRLLELNPTQGPAANALEQLQAAIDGRAANWP